MAPQPPPAIVRIAFRRLTSIYARAGVAADDVLAFVDAALDDAWQRQRWRGVISLAIRLLPDVARASIGRTALPISATRVRFTRSSFMDRWLADVRTAVRGLLRTPSFTVVACLTLALGIGASTAVFAVVDGAILRPFTYPDMPRIVLLSEHNRASGQGMSVSYPNFLDWRASQDVLSELGLYRTMTLNLSGGEVPERLNGSLVSASVFETMGLAPIRGRVFAAADDAPGVGRIAVISERLWESRFQRDAAIVGASIRLNDEAYAIVGVMPAGMRFPSRTTDVWLPLGLFVNGIPNDRGSHPGLTAVGRLAPGVTLDRARAAMETIARRLEQEYPKSNHGNTVLVTSYHEAVVSGVRPAMQLLLGAVALLVLMACANVGSLLLARTEARRQELSIRAALGAGRGRLIRQLLVESLVVATVSGAAGLALAQLAVQVFVSTEPTIIPRVDLIAVDLRVAAFAGAMSLLTVVAFGLYPARRASAPDLQDALRDVRAAGAGRRAMRVRRGLVSTQVAIAAVLVIAAALLGRSLARLQAIDPGFDPSRVVTMRVAISDARYPDQRAWAAFYDRLLDDLRRVPGVDAIGFNTALPMEGGGSESFLMKEGDPLPSHDRPAAMCLFQTTGGDYFGAMRIPLVRGRGFDARDRTDGPPAVIVSDTVAARLFPGIDPIGQRIAFESAGEGHDLERPFLREIVGVVATVKHYGLLANRTNLQVYVPHTQPVRWQQTRRPAMAIVARTAGSADAIVGSVRRAVASVDATVPVFGVTTMESVLRSQTEQLRLAGGLIGAFAGIALALAIVGLYGLLAYTVSLRTREIGVRMALGARRVSILRQVLGQAMRLTGIGLAAGIALALAAGGWLRTQLYDISPTDWLTYAIVSLAFAGVAVLASLVPARRAASVDPVVALRGDG